MNLLLALTVGTIFGAGTYLLLKPDLFRVVSGVVLVANAAALSLMASGLSRGEAPILPFDDSPSDPLVQALTLTAIVIGFGVTAFLLALVYRLYETHSTFDLDELARAENTREHEADNAPLEL